MPGCGTGRAGPVVHRTARLRRSAGGCSSCVGSAVGVRPISGSRSAWPLRRCRRSSTLRVWDALTRVIGPPTPQSCQRSGISVNAPATLIHVDVKKLGGIPSGGGWRTRGRGYPGEGAKARMVGYRYLHSAIDDRTRIVYSEILDNEQASTAAGFWARAAAWYQSIGIPVERVTTDNGPCYRSGLWHRGMRRDRDHREQDPALPAPNKRQDRAIPPDPLRGIGLHSALDLRNPTGPRLHRVRAFLQSPPIPRSTRLGNPNQHPQGQPPRDAQLARHG